MLEAASKIYDEIIEDAQKERSFSIDFSELREGMLDKITRLLTRAQECKEAGIDSKSDPIFQEILNEKDSVPKRPKRPTRKEQYIITATKLKDLNIESGSILPCEFSTYYALNDYAKLSFEQFCSYLYWRTQIRNQNFCVAPTPYLWLYLVELCNFVEFDTVEETYDMFQQLLSIQTHYDAKTMIHEAISSFLIYYGTVEQVQKHQERNNYFQGVTDAVSLLNGTHPDPFDFVVKQSYYKIKNSPTYQEYPDTVKKHFLLFFSNIVNSLKDEGIDILPLYFGKYMLREPREELIKTTRQEYIVEKVFCENDIVLRQVNKDGVIEARMECLGQDVDPGQCIFNRNYIFDYPFRSFDNQLRECLGIETIKASTKDIHKMLERSREHTNLQRLVNFYESDAFMECLKNSLNGFKEELEQQANSQTSKKSTEYIYCGVEFEDKKRIYSYITNDDSISVGNKVVVPTGLYNYEDIATVRSVDKFTILTAPYPPDKTKRIIRKHQE